MELERQKQAEILAAQKAESDRLAKIEADKQAKLQAENDAKVNELKRLVEKAAKELEEKEKAELKAIKDAEIKASEERALVERLAKKAASASDKVKLTTWLNSIKLDEFAPENIKPESVKIANDIMSKLEAFKSWAKVQIETL